MSTTYKHTHTHARGRCPVTGDSNEWCPAQAGDSRSPCPALNTLANHGYLPRNGKNISPRDFVHGLKAGYHLSTFFAWFLTIGTYILLRQLTRLSLHDIGRHNYIEHDASLAHQNTEMDEEYAPCEVDDTLLAALCDDAKTPGKEGARLNAVDIARARVRREKESPKLSRTHAEVARGEMAIALGVFGGKNGSEEGIPVDWLVEWIKDERLPHEWEYTHTQGIFETIKASGTIRDAMKRMTESEGELPMVNNSFLSGEMHKVSPPIWVSDDENLADKKLYMGANY